MRFARVSSAVGSRELAEPVEDHCHLTALRLVDGANHDERAAVPMDVVVVVQRRQERIDDDPARRYLHARAVIAVRET